MTAKQRWFLIVILAVFCLLYLGLFFLLIRTGPLYPYSASGSDETEYARLGFNIFERGIFSPNFHPPFQVETFRTPGYPFVVGLVYWLFNSFQPVILLQIIFILLSGWLIYLMGEKSGHKLAGILAAVLFIFDPVTITGGFQMLSDILFVFVLLLAVYALFFRELSYRLALAGGLLLALTILIRPIGIYIPIVVIPFYWHRLSFSLNLRQAIASTLLFVLGISLFLPWCIRNKLETGILGLSSITAYNLLNYNVRGWLMVQKGLNDQQADSILTKASGVSLVAGRDLTNQPKVMKAALSFIRQNPASYAEYHLLHLISFFIGSGSLELNYFLASYHLVTKFAPRPLAENFPDLIYHGRLELANRIITDSPLICLEHFSLLLIFTFGMCALCDKKNRSLSLLFLALIFYFAIATGPVSFPRYRLPASPFLFLSFALTVEWLWHRYHAIWVKLLAETSNKTNIQLFRYTIVGGLSFLIDFSLLYILVQKFELDYLIAATISFIAGSILNYVLSISWIFPIRTVQNTWSEFFVFTSLGLTGLCLNDLIIWGFAAGLGLNYLVSKIGSAVIVYLWNFFIRKILLFNKSVHHELRET